LWVAGSLNSPSLFSSFSGNFSDCFDLFDFSDGFDNCLTFLYYSLLYSFTSTTFTFSSGFSVLVSISSSDSLSTSHDPSPSPSPDPCGCSHVPFISISGSDSPSTSHRPSPFPFPSEALSFVASFSSFPVAFAPEPLISDSSAVDDSPFPGPISSGDSSTSVFVIELVSNSSSSPSSPSP